MRAPPRPPRERPCGARRFFASRSPASACASRPRECSGRRRKRIDAVLERCQLGSRFGGPREQLRVGLAPESPLGVGDPLELGLDLLEPIGLGLRASRGNAAARASSRSAGARCRAAPRRHLELRRDPATAAERPLRSADECRGALALVRRERRTARPPPPRARSRAGAAPAPRAATPSASSVEPVACPRRGPAARQPRLLGRGAALSSSCRRRAAPSSRHASRSSARSRSCSSPTNASRTSSWYEGRASRRCSNWPDIAISRSAAAARSSRAALRPHA